MRLLLFHPPLATLNDLQTIYSIEDFYDFMEIIDVNISLKKEEMRRIEAERDKK